MIWLVGCRGMLGREVAARLAASATPFVESDIEVDITDESAVRRFVDARAAADLEWIVNCAAYTAVDKAEDEPLKAEAINSLAVRHLAEAAAARNAGVVHISTDYVYDGAKSGAYVESDLPGPIGSYGRSKLGGERHLAAVLDEHYVLRTSWLFGRHGPNFVRTMLRLFDEREVVSIVDDQWGSPTYAVDLAAAIGTLVTTGDRRWGIYHFSNEGRTNWFEFASEIRRRAAGMGMLRRTTVELKPITTAQYPTKARRPANSYMSKAKIEAAFGMTIRPWQDALTAFLKELQSAQAE